VLARAEPFEPQPLEDAAEKFVEEQGIKISDIIHAAPRHRHGQSVGPGVYVWLFSAAGVHRLQRAVVR
jgi:hypothetical protein